MWFIGRFENGSWGFQQEGCVPRYTSKHEAETINDMYEALKEVIARIASYEMNGKCLFCSTNTDNLTPVENFIREALSKADGK